MTFEMICYFIFLIVAVYLILSGRLKAKLIAIETVRILAPLSVIFAKIFKLVSILFSILSKRMMNFSDDVKSFEEKANLQEMREKELLKDEFGNAVRIIRQEWLNLKQKDKQVYELFDTFLRDSYSNNYKIVYSRMMTLDEIDDLHRKLIQVANEALKSNAYEVQSIEAPELVVGEGGIYISRLFFILKSDREASDRRIARYQERENSEVDSVESVL